jgi:prolyl 4-hydroxylase
MIIREANERLPVYSRPGFWRTNVPSGLFVALRAFYEAHCADAVEERVPGFITSTHSVASELIALPDSLKRASHKALARLVQEWCGAPIEPTYVYGIRRYRRGATLKIHRDRLGTHVFGVIVNIEQAVSQDWPLVVEDHVCRSHTIVLAPGQMLFYEGARLPHGRPAPLNGESYASVFVHYRPSENHHGRERC